MEREPIEKQEKYKNRYYIAENEEIHFTGMFKFVDSGVVDEFGQKVYKRKRVFRKIVKDKRYLTNEEK